MIAHLQPESQINRWYESAWSEGLKTRESNGVCDSPLDNNNLGPRWEGYEVECSC